MTSFDFSALVPELDLGTGAGVGRVAGLPMNRQMAAYPCECRCRLRCPWFARGDQRSPPHHHTNLHLSFTISFLLVVPATTLLRSESDLELILTLGFKALLDVENGVGSDIITLGNGVELRIGSGETGTSMTRGALPVGTKRK